MAEVFMFNDMNENAEFFSEFDLKPVA